MHEPAEQTSQDDVIIRQQQMDREQAIHDHSPASFGDYLRRRGVSAGRSPRSAVRHGVVDIAEKAKRAPRTE